MKALKFLQTSLPLLLLAASPAWAQDEEPVPAVTDSAPADTESGVAASQSESATPAAPTPLSINEQMTALIADHQYGEAYRMAIDHLQQMEGDPVFDFNYGFSAAQNGFFNEALFPFERLVEQYPDVPRYRLELARAYFNLGNPEAAEEQFLIVKAGNPPANVAATIETFLAKINEQKQMIRPVWNGYVTVSGGYDTNYNSATDLQQIDLYNGAFSAVLNSSDRAQSSGYYQLRGQASYISPVNARSAWDVQLGASRKDNAADDLYDLDNLYAAAGWRHLAGEHNLHLSVKANRYWLGDQELLSEYSLNGDWRYPLGNWQLSSALAVRSQDNELNNELDMLQTELQGGFTYLATTYSLQAALVVATDSADASYQARDTLGLNLSGQYLLSMTSSLYASMMARSYQFQDAYPVTNAFAAGETRDERLLQFATGYGRTLLPWLSVYAQLSYLDYASNVDLYRYNRTLTEAGLTLSF